MRFRSEKSPSASPHRIAVRRLLRSRAVARAGLTLACALSLSATVGAAEPAPVARKFDFGAGPAPAGWTRVPADAAYSAERGYGFEPGSKLESLDRAAAPDLLALKDSAQRELRADAIASETPFYFSAALPEGSYRVTVTLGDAAGVSDTTVKAELRRLVLEKVKTAEGEFTTRAFTVNLRRPQIAGAVNDDGKLREVRLKPRERAEEAWAWDDKLTLEFNGARPSVAALEIEPAPELPTVFLIGDSTVADQPREPYASWGQMFTRFFKPGVVVANHSESGESLASAIGERRLEKILSVLRPGDWVFVQFGHNDMKSADVPTYKATYKTFTAALREKQAKVVLVTQMNRHSFNAEGKVTNSHAGYPDAVREVAREESLPLIDLHAMSLAFYESMGAEKARLAFKQGDGTHHNAYGAYELAKCVVEGIRVNQLPLASHIVDDLPRFDPAKPDPLETFSLPPSSTAAAAKPDGS